MHCHDIHEALDLPSVEGQSNLGWIELTELESWRQIIVSLQTSSPKDRIHMDISQSGPEHVESLDILVPNLNLG